MSNSPLWIIFVVTSMSCSSDAAGGADASDLASSDAQAVRNDGGMESDGPDGATATNVPAESCITPCLWELLTSCRPAITESCMSNEVGVIEDRCYSGGTKVRLDDSAGEYFTDNTYYWPDGSVCFSSSYAGDVMTYSNAIGEVLITRYLVGAMESIHCDGEVFAMHPTMECVGSSLDTPACTAGTCVVE